MKPVDLSALAQDPEPQAVVIGKGQEKDYLPLPALAYSDGKRLIEFDLTEEERQRLIRGERIRLWVQTFGKPFQPIAIEVTDEHRA